MDLRPLLKQAWQADAEIVGNITPKHFDGPTRCTEWNTRTLLNHFIGDNYLMVHLANGGIVDPKQQLPDFVADATPAAAFEQSVKNATAAIDEEDIGQRVFHFPWADTPGEQAIGVFLNEAVVHGLDLAHATGQRSAGLEAIGDGIFPFVEGTIPDAFRGPGMPFAHRFEVPDDAPGHAKLLAYLGRQP